MTDAKSGHNGGPALNEPAGPQYGCKYCIHWKPPPERKDQAYEHFRLGLSRKRVRRPTGYCQNAIAGVRDTPCCCATPADYYCRNFSPQPLKPVARGGGFVTVWQNGRIVWQGDEENILDRLLQQELDLQSSPTGRMK